MARPRTFDEEQALDAAMLTFWRHGYDATTYKLLEKATGVGVRSLVNIFGEKDRLFARILDRYRAMAENILDQVFAPPSVEALLIFFGSMAAERDEDDIANAGCLMVNTVFELGRGNAQVRDKVEAYRELFRSRFEASLATDGIANAGERAEFLVGLLWGMLSQIRLAGNVGAVAPMAATAQATIQDWR